MRRLAALSLSLLGLFDSLYLLYSYTSPSRPMVCIGTGCDAVRASVYSSLAGVPMPIFGVLGYALLAIAIVAGSLFSGRVARAARYAFLGLSGFGFLFSLYLEYLQAFVIHAFCAWCVTSGVAMTALFALAIVNLARREPEPEPPAQLARVQGFFFVGLAALAVGAPGFFLLARHGEVPPPAAQASPAELAARLVRPGAHETGNPQSPLTVVEFGDFECPVCGRGEAVAREIRTRYGDRVRFVFRQFPLERIHPLAQKAAEASECAGEQGKFWEMVEKIYSRQDDLSVKGLERDAAELGLDRPRFNQCLATGSMAPRIRRDAEDGRALSVRATPTFFIGQQRVEGVLTAEQFSQLVDTQLARLGTTVAATAAPSSPPLAAVVTKKAKVPQERPKESADAAPASGADAGRSFSGSPLAAAGGLGSGMSGMASPGLFGAPSGGAACSEAEAAKQQPTLIDTAELRRLLAEKTMPAFVDVRSAGDYAAGHVPGAINVPVDEIAQRSSTLPKDRTIVLYESGRSSGDICAAGRAAGRALLERGFAFPLIKVYQDGLAGWQRAGIGADQQ